MSRVSLRAAALVSLFVLVARAGGAADPAKLGEDMIKAAAKGDLAKVQALLGQGAGVNSRDKDGRTALLRASQEGRTAVVQALLAASADPNLADEDHK